ncbi:Gfo/Idh/MocA family protein [Domibacillus indicus]|uniref:Gfo/Idh/MocA family protein n=1 Tax=Domibacillus indicus TaxID=1437523 RepID=UPI000617E3A8|nr:Gfo/Idh/MocA family oxidoreductase [Domibacillus indicus]
MVGYKFMGKAHSNAYQNAPFFFDLPVKPVKQAICGRNAEGVKEAADKMGWKSYETDWRTLINREDIDLIDIVTPNNNHAEIAIAAAEAGKHVYCEKPLALTIEESAQMLEAVQKNNVIHMVNFNYRFAPAIQFAKKLISEGKIGRIYHMRALYLQDWIMDPDFPLVWRLEKSISGSGAHGDLAAHSIDLARFLVGEIDEVSGMMKTFIKKRPAVADSSGLSGKASATEFRDVEVDDASIFIASFQNGAAGTFEATRFAGGNRNSNQFEINGEKGSIKWNAESMNELEVYFADDDPSLQGFKKINVTEEVHPYGGVYWPSAHIIGYEHTFHNLIAELMKGIEQGVSLSPTFYDGHAAQAILTAVEKSARSRRWEKVDTYL